jgi:hypothetical protein
MSTAQTQVNDSPSFFEFLIRTTEIPSNPSPIEKLIVLLGCSKEGSKQQAVIVDKEVQEDKQNEKAMRILKKVCEVVGIDFVYLTGTRLRKEYLVHCKNLAIYFIRGYTSLTLKKIGRLMIVTGRPYDHSTVIHASNKCQDDIDAMTEKHNFYSNYLKLKKFFEEEFTTIETI